MEKLSDLLEMAKVSDIIATKKEKEDNKIVWALAIIGAIAAVAGIAFAVYKYLTPDYMDDFDEDFDDDFDDIPSSKSYKKAEKQTAATKQPKSAKQTSTASSKVTPMYNVKKPASSSEVCVIKPKQFDDATEIVDALLDNCTVILNLEGLDINLAQHIIDFTSGASYSIQGSIRKVSSYIFILTPEGVDITGDSQDLLNDITGASMYEGI